MRKIIGLGSLAFLFLISPAIGKEIGGVNLPDQYRAGEETLILNGCGLRKKFVIKVYAGGLYLKQAAEDARKIIEADEPMAIRMHFIYDGVSAKDLIAAWNEGFQNAMGGDITPIREKVDRFNAMFQGDAKKNDIYDVLYLPGKGVSVSLNSKLAGTVEGLEFKKAVFSIWLGETPADSGLKKGMLGK
jgi:hypothetical protein